MRKVVLIIAALMMLSACGGGQQQPSGADAAVAEPTEMTAQPSSCSLTGTIGEDVASMVLERDGNEVTGVVTRCDVCLPIDIEGSWRGSVIRAEGMSLAGSHIRYELTVEGNAVEGTEILSAEGAVEEQEVRMTM